MVKELVTRAEFSRIAGVSAAAVTGACDGILKKAVAGKRINAKHKDAIAYIKNHSKERPPVHTEGIDSLYNDAVDVCKKANRYSANIIKQSLNIGTTRATKIFKTMQSAGDVPDNSKKEIIKKIHQRNVAEETREKPHARGHVSKNETKKGDSPGDGPEIEVPVNIQDLVDMTLRELIDKFGTDIYFVDWLAATKKIEDIAEKRIKNAALEGTLISRELVKIGIIDTLDGAFTRMLSDGSKTIAVRAKALIEAGGNSAAVEELVAKQLTSFINPTKAKIARVLRNA